MTRPFDQDEPEAWCLVCGLKLVHTGGAWEHPGEAGHGPVVTLVQPSSYPRN